MSKNPTRLRIPPQNLDSEKAVLGSIMLRPNALFEIEDQLSSDSFYSERHRIIFKAMLDLSVKHEPIDLVSLSTKLKEKKQLDQIGGNSYLTELTNAVPSSTNIKHYADIVEKKSVL